MKGQSSGLVAQFIAGLIAGILVLAGELEFFAASLIADAFSKVVQTFPSATPSLLLNFSAYILLFTIIGIVQNFLIGYISPMAFATGFLLGDLLVLLFVCSPLWAVVPSIVIGMATTFITALIGLFVRFRAEEHNHY